MEKIVIDLNKDVWEQLKEIDNKLHNKKKKTLWQRIKAWF